MTSNLPPYLRFNWSVLSALAATSKMLIAFGPTSESYAVAAGRRFFCEGDAVSNGEAGNHVELKAGA